MKKLFVGNISYSATEEDLRALFSQYGGVSSVKIITDRETGRSKGFAFVEMEDDNGASAAVAGANNAECKGRALRVSEAHEREGGRGGGGGGGGRGGFGGGDRGGDRGGPRKRW